MWSDKLTEQANTTEKVFDLFCNHPERGEVLVESDLTLEAAVKIATEGGIENAERQLSDAWLDQILLEEIQRPGRHKEFLAPHDWA